MKRQYSKIKICFTCREECLKYKAKFRKLKNFGPYAQGFRWCGECCVFMVWDKSHCPCCGRKVRTRPESTRFKNLDERLYL